MDGFGFHAGRFGEALGGAPRRGAEHDANALGLKDREDGLDDRGFSDARTPGDHHDLGAKRFGHGLALARREREPSFSSAQGRAFAASIRGQGGAVRASALRLRPTLFSAW